MEIVKKLEKTIEVWFKDMPHLPESARKWIGDNVWWMMIVSAVLSGLGILTSLRAISAYMALESSFGGYLSYYSSYYGEYSSMYMVSMVISMVSLIVSMVLSIMAISPLQTKKKKGWDLLFMASLLGFVLALLSSLVTMNMAAIIGSLIGVAIGIAISMYLLFEIKSQFHAGK